jgi:ribonucleoside-diphosphate reductase alpha chain
METNKKIKKVKKISVIKNRDVYDITVEKNHNFIANGTLVHNCCEIGLYPQTIDGRSGFQFCNLTEINGKWCKDEESFLQACRASAIIGTLQAGYTDFKYVSDETKEITDYEALLGCSITGMMDNPEVIFNEETQKKGAATIKAMNETIAGYIGINPAARCTTVKPAGTTSCVLGTASGIHPHHARRYMRRVQANKLEFPVRHFMEKNPLAVEESVWSNNGTDMVISFLCEVPSGAKIKNQLAAVDLLKKVRLTQQNWVEYGTRKERCIKPYIRHNVSNTITVKPDEWDDVEDFIYENRQWFAGISLLSASGDKDYPQAPFTTVHTSTELSKMYGDASHFASGLIVDGLHAFDDNLWKACDTALGIGENLVDVKSVPEQPTRPKKNGYTDKEYSKKLVTYAKKLESYYVEQEQYDIWYSKTDWVRRLKKFALNHFNGDIKTASYCLKDVSNLHLWDTLKQNYTEIDWSDVLEEDEFYEEVDTMGAAACAGGKCDISY